jgi:thioredoxin 1
MMPFLSETIAGRLLVAILLAAIGLGLWTLTRRLALLRARRAGGAARVAASGGAGILLFGSVNCPACVHAQEPAARSLVEELGGRVRLVEVDVDESPEMAREYGVLSLPTVVVLGPSGRPARVFRGLVSKDRLRRELETIMGSAAR